MKFDYSKCKDNDCFIITPKNTISLWDTLREDYMLTDTGNRIYWGGTNQPKGPKTIQVKENSSCE